MKVASMSREIASRGFGRRGGWSGRRSDPLIESHATLIEAEPVGFTVGERVFHQKFGYGRVTSIDRNKLAIAFDKAGDKKVLDSFVVAADAR